MIHLPSSLNLQFLVFQNMPKIIQIFKTVYKDGRYKPKLAN